MKKLSLVFLVFILTISCKEKEQKDEDGMHNKEFTVALDVEVSEPDNFSLYYTEDESINFDVIPPLWASVKGSSNVQRVIFTLPKGAKPTQIRLDFGTNKKQEDIIFRQFTFTYGNKKFDVAGPEIFTYFRPDGSKCKINTSSCKITAIEKDGVRQTPSLYPHEDALGAQIKCLTN